MDQVIRILHLEDDAADAELAQALLESAGLVCDLTRVQTREEFGAALRKGGFDLILADFRLPMYDGMSALRLVRERKIDLPFIFVSGTMGEDAAIEGLTEGATDYVLKQKLARLPPAIKRALGDAENRKEHQRMEAALRESEARFRAVADSANEGIITADGQGIIVYWNKAASTIFGYAEAEIVGQPLTKLMPEEPREEYRPGLRGWPKLDERGWVGRIIEAAGRRKDGSLCPVEISMANWQTAKGEFFTAMVRDITERKQNLESLHLQSAALEAAANGMLITDREGCILWTNPAFTRLTGYTAEEARGQNPRLLKSGHQDRTFYQNLWNRILSGKVWRGELVNRRKDGSLYPEEMTITPVRAAQGDISHFIAIKQDISQRKQHETEREAIIAVANAVRTALTRAEMIPVLLDQVNDLFHADGATLAMSDVATGEILIELGRGRVGVNFSGIRIPPGQGVSGLVIATGKPCLNNDIRTDTRFAHPELLGDAHAVACAPLIAQEQTIGALWFVRTSDIAEGELRLLNAIADIAANAIHRATLYEQTRQRLHRLAALHAIDMAISSSFDLELSLNVLISNVITELDVDAADVLLFKSQMQVLEYAAGRGFKTRNIEQSRVIPGLGQAGTSALTRQILARPDLHRAPEPFGRAALLAGEGFVSHFAAPLVAKGQLQGVLEIFHRHRLDPPVEWLGFLETLATQAAIAIDNMTLFDNLQRSNADLTMAYEATIEGWSRALDLRDKETEGHTQRVTEMTTQLAKVMGMSDPEIGQVRHGALLHDIGKMGIPDAILLKPGPLTAEEEAIMRMHPVYAFELLSPIAYLRPALDIPHYHHERWDGTGYPHGLKGEQIPLAARLFAVVDVWDALRSDRPYRQAWSEERVREYIHAQSGFYFDPTVAQVFLRMMKY